MSAMSARTAAKGCPTAAPALIDLPTSIPCRPFPPDQAACKSRIQVDDVDIVDQADGCRRKTSAPSTLFTLSASSDLRHAAPYEPNDRPPAFLNCSITPCTSPSTHRS